jgi:hypothetical protein
MGIKVARHQPATAFCEKVKGKLGYGGLAAQIKLSMSEESFAYWEVHKPLFTL